MSNIDKTQTAQSFAANFARALQAVLAPLTAMEWPFSVLETAQPTSKNAGTSFRFAAEGAVEGEFFVEFTDPLLCAILSGIVKQPVTKATPEHLDALERLMASVGEKLSEALAGEWGDVRFRVETVAELAFGGMQVVALATRGADPESQLLLRLDARLRQALAADAGASARRGAASGAIDARNLRLVMDVELNVSLRFGQRKLQLRDVLDLSSGSIVELDRMVDEPVELFLGDKLIARGEAVVVDGNYGLRVTEIPQPVTSHFLN